MSQSGVWVIGIPGWCSCRLPDGALKLSCCTRLFGECFFPLEFPLLSPFGFWWWFGETGGCRGGEEGNALERVRLSRKTRPGERVHSQPDKVLPTPKRWKNIEAMRSGVRLSLRGRRRRGKKREERRMKDASKISALESSRPGFCGQMICSRSASLSVPGRIWTSNRTKSASCSTECVARPRHPRCDATLSRGFGFWRTEGVPTPVQYPGQ